MNYCLVCCFFPSGKCFVVTEKGDVMVAPGAGDSRTSPASCSGDDFPAESTDTRDQAQGTTVRLHSAALLWFCDFFFFFLMVFENFQAVFVPGINLISLEKIES